MATTQSTTKVVFKTTFSVAETTADYFTVTPPLVFPRNDIYGKRVTTCHYPDLGYSSDWLRQSSLLGTTNEQH